LELDHLCRVRHCVNPAHLQPVTRAVNARRGARAKLTASQAAEIRSIYGLGRISMRELGSVYGVDHKTIQAVVSGRSWGTQ
jgi:hypothetical protein